jgi:hypothetical protein
MQVTQQGCRAFTPIPCAFRGQDRKDEQQIELPNPGHERLNLASIPMSKPCDLNTSSCSYSHRASIAYVSVESHSLISCMRPWAMRDMIGNAMAVVGFCGSAYPGRLHRTATANPGPAPSILRCLVSGTWDSETLSVAESLELNIGERHWQRTALQPSGRGLV